MSSCRRTQRHLLEVVRRTASDAVRLEVEAHLEDCVACQEERARLGLLGVIKDQAIAHLGEAAERRIVKRLVDRRAAPLPGRGAALGAKPRAVFFVGALTLTALVLSLRLGFFRRAPGGPAEGERIQATSSGTISFGGAQIAYEAGTAMTVHPVGRHLSLTRGEIEVDVTEGLPGRFRVTTTGFIVEVLGTRFVVTPTSVHTLRGHVRILDLREHELAVLHAGESWSAAADAASARSTPEAPARAAPSASVSPGAPDVAKPASPSPERHPSVAPRQPSVSELLSRTRAALADGDAEGARTLIQRARARSPSDADAAAIELLDADTWLVGGHPDEAVSAFRRLFRRRPGAPEGEMASFTIGQLLAERGAHVEAASALNDYLAHYPQGRFVREARERLAQLQAAP
jgi:Tetratricopeptide repeat/FecR protein